jgi:hypothetical protein
MIFAMEFFNPISFGFQSNFGTIYLGAITIKYQVPLGMNEKKNPNLN